VVSSILDLGPMLISRLEAWVTKRTVVQTREGQSAEPRLGLAGSDSKAFADLLPDIVGAWEGLLHHVGSMYRWRDGNEQTDENRWAAYSSMKRMAASQSSQLPGSAASSSSSPTGPEYRSRRAACRKASS